MTWKTKLLAAIALTLPSLVLHFSGATVPAPTALLVFATAIVAASFVLSWAAEVAEVDLAGGIAIALLALVAVLPELLIAVYFAFEGGHHASVLPYASANVTGSNRLLMGLATPVAGLVALSASRRRSGRRGGRGGVRATRLDPGQALDLGAIIAAVPIIVLVVVTRTLAWYDGAALLIVYATYLILLSRGEKEEIDLVGVAAHIGALAPRHRRRLVTGLFLLAAAVVFVIAEPFATSLIATGQSLHINQYLLVQWLAPLASESPELIIATLLARRGKGGKALAALLASEVNQWTLAIGALPFAHLVGGGGGAIGLGTRSTAEYVLTIAQAALGVSILIDFRVTRREAWGLVILFFLQLGLTTTSARLVLAGAEGVLAVIWFVVHRRHLHPLVRRLLGREVTPLP